MTITKQIFPEIITELKFLQDRTGLTPRQMLALTANEQFPAGLKYHHINKWLSGEVKEAPSTHIDFVLAQWRSVPEEEHMVTITEQMQRNLMDYRTFTGVGPRLLLRGRRQDIPTGLTATEIAKWLSGLITKTQQKKLNYVLRLWAECSDIVDVSDHFRQQLLAEKQRTGIGTTALMALAENAPDKLTYQTIQNWLNKSAQRARIDHMSYVLNLWRSLPNKITPR